MSTRSMARRWVTCASVFALGGCALKGDVKRVEDQLAEIRAEQAAAEAAQSRADSAQAVMLMRLIDEVAHSHNESDRLLDSLKAELQSLFTMQGAFRGDITDVQRQLDAIEELTGQSQARLSDLRNEIQRSPSDPPLVPSVPVTPPSSRETPSRYSKWAGPNSSGAAHAPRASPFVDCWTSSPTTSVPPTRSTGRVRAS